MRAERRIGALDSQVGLVDNSMQNILSALPP